MIEKHGRIATEEAAKELNSKRINGFIEKLDKYLTLM